MDRVERRLNQLIVAYWRIPPREGRLFLHALLHSPTARATRVRQHLALAEAKVLTPDGVQEVDLHHLFHEVMTPHFMLALVADLRSTGRLSHPQRVVIEASILHAVSATGEWRAVES